METMVKVNSDALTSKKSFKGLAPGGPRFVAFNNPWTQ